MIYVAFLRGINVGGNSIVSMAALKQSLEGIGFTEVRTYINSGNVIFSASQSSSEKLAGHIEGAIEKDIGKAVKVVVLSRVQLGKLISAIPSTWLNDQESRTDVMLLWKPVDTPKVLEQLPANPEIEEVIYTPGAIIWHVDRKNVRKSRMSKLIGTALYKQLSARNVNTIRKLGELVADRDGLG